MDNNNLLALMTLMAHRKGGPTAAAALMSGYQRGMARKRQQSLQERQLGNQEETQALNRQNVLSQIADREAGNALAGRQFEATQTPIPISERHRPFAGGMTTANPLVYNASIGDWEKMAEAADKERNLGAGMDYANELMKPVALPEAQQPLSTGPFPEGQEPKDVTGPRQVQPLELIKLMSMLGKGGIPSEGLTSLVTQMEKPNMAAKTQTENETRPGKVALQGAQVGYLEEQTNTLEWKRDQNAKGSPAWKAINDIKNDADAIQSRAATTIKAATIRARRAGASGGKGYTLSQQIDDYNQVIARRASIAGTKTRIEQAAKNNIFGDGTVPDMSQLDVLDQQLGNLQNLYESGAFSAAGGPQMPAGSNVSINLGDMLRDPNPNPNPNPSKTTSSDDPKLAAGLKKAAANKSVAGGAVAKDLRSRGLPEPQVNYYMNKYFWGKSGRPAPHTGRRPLTPKKPGKKSAPRAIPKAELPNRNQG